MSGSELGTVRLFGSSMSALVKAIPHLEQVLGHRIVLVGGLAVLSRLGSAYRVTTDVDTAHRRADGEPAQLDILVPSRRTLPVPRSPLRMVRSESIS